MIHSYTQADAAGNTTEPAHENLTKPALEPIKDVICVDKIALEVTFDPEALNIHVQDSYRLAYKDQIRRAVEYICDKPSMKLMREAGYKRTPGSMVTEWAAHDTLYRWGISKNRTASVDLNQGESGLRRILYSLIASFCPAHAKEEVESEPENLVSEESASPSNENPVSADNDAIQQDSDAVSAPDTFF